MGPRREERMTFRETRGGREPTHAWSSTAVRNTECFMQIQMRYIGSVVAWTAQTDLGVHIRSIQVNLTTMLMDDVTKLSEEINHETAKANLNLLTESFLRRLHWCWDR